ncbi:hypothetical protein FW774_01810 (plasmid) [Pedobacter sp. BS3]|uniref:OstA-like protein n=1 Tax=Pedobacter sp. BS3 TaxID=2567937 RepID=UPI0011EFD16E|nr:OstA-like protein [Pedobacter sp. BS3]TZF85832.1 hypothetical protein FW774_01810 [Pedobacter sp. BS3]
MKKLFFLIVLNTCLLSAFSQNVKQIQILSSKELRGIKTAQKSYQRIISPVFLHEGTTLASDSADYYAAEKRFNAFGHIVITQPDGTVIYSDLLDYDGNTRVAVLTNNVRMVDKQGATLTTDWLNYNMNTRIGTYVNGGKIVNGDDVLTSKNGYYFSNTRDAYFRYNVVITNKDAITKADTMRYNSDTKTAYFYGPTHIYGKQDTLYTENGNYNTITRQANGVKNNLYTQGTKFLKGDTIFYDDIKGFGRATRNVVFVDTGSQKIAMFGQLGTYLRADSSILMTRYPYVIMETKDSASVDSIYMTADTLFSKLIERRHFKPAKRSIFKSNAELEEEDAGNEADSTAATPAPAATNIPKPPEVKQEKPVEKPKKEKRKRRRDRKKEELENALAKTDSVAAPPLLTSLPDSIVIEQKPRPKTAAELRAEARLDSIRKDSIRFSQDTTKMRIVLAYHHVKVFKSDLQAKADSAFYSYQDSTIRTYINPIVWAQGSQMSADTIYMQIKNQKLDNMLLQHNGFIVNVETDSTKFNQVKGKVLTGFFKNNQLESMFVDGNAESIYYVRDSTGYTGMNRSISSRMRINFAEKQLQDILFIRKPDLVFYPIEKLPKDKDILEGFIWKPKERPKSKEEIIPSLAKQKKPVKPAAKSAPKQPAAGKSGPQ